MRQYDNADRDDKVRRTLDRIALVWRLEEEADEEAEMESIQAKSSLEIGSPDDPQEKEADGVAKKVVNGEDATGINSSAPPLQMKATNEEATLMAKSENGILKGTEELQTKLDSSKGSGQALDQNVKAEMGNKMGADLSDVKIHTDHSAHEMSEGINAKAFTHGQDIYFKQGNYNTNSNEGKELLAHELTHTVQQSGGVKRKIQRKNEKLTDAQRALIIRAGFDPETMPEEDAEVLASILSILETETASAEGQGLGKEKRKVGEYDLVTETRDRLKTISLTGKDSSLLISAAEDDKGASTNTVEFSNKGNKYSVTRTSTPPVLKLEQPLQQGKSTNTTANSGTTKVASLLNNPFQLGVPAYKLVRTIKGKGKLYIAENILEQRRQYNPEFKTYGGNEIIYRRSIKIETEQGKEIYISVKGSDVPVFTNVGNLMDVKGKTELEISINGRDSAQNELHIFNFENKDDISFNEAIQSIAGKGPSAYLMERVPLDEKYFDEAIKTTALFWQAQPRKEQDNTTSDVAKANKNDLSAEKNNSPGEKGSGYPSKEELATMDEKEKLQVARDKFWEEFQISNVLTNVAIGLGIMGGLGSLVGAGIITAVAGVIAGAVIGIVAVIYSYWDSVFKHLLSGDFDKIEPIEAMKAALYIIGIIAGTVALLASSPAVAAAAAIIAVAAFVSAIVYGATLAYNEVKKAASSLTPVEFKEHTQKAARHAEQATSDAIMGLIAKYFAKIIETNKPLIGPQNENASPGMGLDKSKLPVSVEERKPVTGKAGAETKPLPKNQKPGEEIVKEVEKTKSQEKETVKPEKTEKELVSSPFDKKGKLKPNVKYVSGEYGYQGETDALGRIANVSTDNLRLSEAERLRHNPKTPGKIKGDHAGHLFGDRFGGSPELDNLVSQTSKINLSEFKTIENLWAREIVAGRHVEVKIKINYTGEELRPTFFVIEWEINGDFFKEILIN